MTATAPVLEISGDQSAPMTPRQLVEQYLKRGYRLVFWPANGDQKGPKDPGWTSRTYTIDDYRDGYRVGAVTGAEVEPGRFLVDVDIDWAPGSLVAQNLLPPTGFVYGRTSKRVSHCFYTLPETVPTVRYEDIDKTVLLELRGTTSSGSLGMQSMVPPSIWSKDGNAEPLTFAKSGKPAHLDTSQLKHRVTLAAIGMLFAKHFGKNGFGHESRLAWAGYMLRAGVPVDDLIAMGEAVSIHCNNQELKDVRLVVESTAARLASDTKKIKGSPALAKLMGDGGKAVIARIDEWLGVSRRAGSQSLKTQLVQQMLDGDADLFHSADGLAYATVIIGAHRETMALGSRAFDDYISGLCYSTHGKVPSGGDLKDATRVLIAHAKHNGPQHDVFIRVARVGDEITIDLGRPEWEAVKITRDGWRIVASPDVKFRRSRGLLALPIPVRGSDSLVELIRPLINVSDPRLPLSWLVGSLRGRKPYAILVVTGEQGSGKTAAERFVRRVIDPNTADLRIPPKEPRDLMIAAMNSHVIAFDNLSVIPDWLSDALCGLATGGGFSTRELFSDLDETLFRAERPIMLNGITSVVTRPDLLDRAITVTLEPITDDQRRSESDLEHAFTEAHPAILAALFDAVAMALANESTTKLDRLPRMADFATWVVAAGPALGWQGGEFIDAYRSNQEAALEGVIEGDPVIDTIKELRLPWEGQLKDLHGLIPDSEHKPKSPRGLRSALTRKAPALRHLGYTLTYTKGHEHKLIISRGPVQQTLAEPRAQGAYDDTPF